MAILIIMTIWMALGGCLLLAVAASAVQYARIPAGTLARHEHPFKPKPLRLSGLDLGKVLVAKRCAR
jgi:hypothetical protein